MGTTLITGAYGQVGQELVPILTRRLGRENVVLADIASPPERFRDYLNHRLDVTDRATLEKVISEHGVDHIFHLAAILSASGEKNPARAFMTNAIGTHNILEAARELSVKKVMIPSTIGVFSRETPRRNVPVNTIMKPRTMYGITKVTGEMLGNYYFQKFGLDVRGVRFPGLISYSAPPGGGTTDYSVEMFHYAVRKEKYACYIDRNTVLPMMYMPDAMKAMMALFDADINRLRFHSDYNISAFSFSPLQLEEVIRKRVPGFTVTYAPDYRQEIASEWPETIDSSDAARDWGFRAEYDLDSMVDDMLMNLTKKER